ncbi:conjugative transposon protein TraJ, partial [Bacteroides caecigallinarum]|nr:conjugative transposon protein TraJ [Bacteroides caecigallinarum]
NINRTATKAGGFAAGAAGSGLGNIGGRLRGK